MVDAFEAIAILEDPVRRGLYEFTRRAGRAVTREEAAGTLRISTKLAAFHLDKLVGAGLLEAHAEIPEGTRRRVGRAPKRYQLSEAEVALSLPPRRYDLLGEILLEAVLDSTSSGEQATYAALSVARDHGRQLGASAGLNARRVGPERAIASCETILDELGFLPTDDGEGGLALLNCPFHDLMAKAPEFVCSLNAAFVDGLLRGLGNDSVHADLVPEEGRCCVCVRPPNVDLPMRSRSPI